MISIANNRIELRYDDELLIVEPWGKNSVRVRAFPDQHYVEHNNALLPMKQNIDCSVKHNGNSAVLINGKIKVKLDHRNRLIFYNQDDDIILKEFIRLRAVKHDDGSEDVGTIQVTKDFNSTLKLKSREYRGNSSGNFQINTRFESNNNEKIYGMGQYQQEYLDLKYTTLELAQRNSQMSIPFYVSNLNYGFLWNNPGIGKVTFSKNITEWSMYSTQYIDYWVTVGDTPKEILTNYADVTGHAPVMPDNLLGLWQSKLRYRTPEEVLEVVKGYKDRNIQLSTIAIDYFHWPNQGEYQFDTDFWSNPEQLIKTLKDEYNVEPIISVWPTVQTEAKNYETYLENGYLVKVNRGIRMTMQIQGNTVFIDTTNEEACKYVWSLLEKNYKQLGIDYYWIDVAEPGYAVYDFDNYRYDKGTTLECGNLYPIGYLKMIYDGNDGENNPIVTLVRGAWAGAQRYGALPWSGDIDSSFEAFRNQINTGLNVGMAGIPWWTTDIGGFHGGNPEDEEFRELMIRWFQYSTFSPVLRMHGDRLPHSKPLSNSGGGSMPTGAPNEIWSYGDVNEEIFTFYIRLRELLKEYLSSLMLEAHKYGYPVMRTLFTVFPNDSKAWEVDNTYMLGDKLLVAPVIYYKERKRKVYMPGEERWVHLFTGQSYEGGKEYDVEAPLNEIPIFIREKNLNEFNNIINYIKNS